MPLAGRGAGASPPRRVRNRSGRFRCRGRGAAPRRHVDDQSLHAPDAALHGRRSRCARRSRHRLLFRGGRGDADGDHLVLVEQHGRALLVRQEGKKRRRLVDPLLGAHRPRVRGAAAGTKTRPQNTRPSGTSPAHRRDRGDAELLRHASPAVRKTAADYALRPDPGATRPAAHEHLPGHAAQQRRLARVGAARASSARSSARTASGFSGFR